MIKKNLKSNAFTKILFIAVIFLLLNNCGVSQTSRVPLDFKGRWEGTTAMFGHKFNVAFDFSDSKSTYDVIESGIYYEQLKRFTLNENGSFIITIPSKPEMILKGNIRNDVMSGIIEGENKIPVELKRISHEPAFLAEEEVSYKSGGILLSGTLIKPGGTEPHPAIVLISGSAGQGRMTRERTRNMGYFFAKNGIAALIYDRRGNGNSQGEPDRIIRMDMLANDAAAGAEYLSARKDINKNKIGFYGLSQGGWVAPYAASIFKRTSFIFVISAPGIQPDEQNRFASINMANSIIANKLLEAGVPENAVKNLKEKGPSDIVEKNEKETIPGFSFFDPLPYWENIMVPVLAIYGSEDRVVPVEESQSLIENALKKAGNKKYLFKLFPGADHELKISLNAHPPFMIPAPGLQEFMAGWIRINVIDN